MKFFAAKLEISSANPYENWFKKDPAMMQKALGDNENRVQLKGPGIGIFNAFEAFSRRFGFIMYQEV